MAQAYTTVQISEDVTEVSITETGKVEIEINEDTTVVEVNNLAIPAASVAATDVAFTPHGSITATNLNEAIQQLADQDFRSTSAPTGSNVEEGDTWYDTDDDIFYVYRTIDGVTDWVPLLTTDTPDETDGGAF
jgi:hypothetical protein